MQGLQQIPASDGPIAPAWHTVLMILLVLSPLIQAKVAAWHNPGATLQPPPAVAFYLTGTVVLFVFLLFTWWGLRLTGRTLGSLVGGKWSNWKQELSDIAIGTLFWVFWYAVLSALKLGLIAAGLSNSHSSGMVFPTGGMQVGLVIFNAILSGIVEEVVFCGYLLAQFTAWTGSVPLAIVVQGVLFGAAHGFYLGTRAAHLLFAAGHSSRCSRDLG